MKLDQTIKCSESGVDLINVEVIYFNYGDH